MTIKKLEELLNEGEGYTIEFKKSVDSLSNSIFETVSSFSNRYGGYILLGVKEVKRENKKVGEVIGVNPEKVADMKQNFINLLNNPQKMAPSLYLNLEEIEYKGMIVLWVYVPVSSQIEICCGKIYDRNGDADQDVTTSADMVANISNRKSAAYIERKIFPYATEEDLCIELVGKARQMAVNKFKDHPWGNMTDMELLEAPDFMEKIWKAVKKALIWHAFFCSERQIPFSPACRDIKRMPFIA